MRDGTGEQHRYDSANGMSYGYVIAVQNVCLASPSCMGSVEGLYIIVQYAVMICVNQKRHTLLQTPFVFNLLLEICLIYSAPARGEDEFSNISATILSIVRNLQSSQRQEERFSVIQKGIGERPQTIDGSPAGLYTLLDTLSPGKARQQLLHRYCGIGHPFKVDVNGVPLHTSADTIDEKIYSPERGEAVAIVMTPPTAFLLDLLKNVRCVRPAIQADIPLIRKFFSNHLSCQSENHSPRANSNYWENVENLIDFRWKIVFEGINPIVVGVSDDAVVGVAMVWAERLVEIFIDPTNEIHFFPALLRGIVEHSARLGLSHVEAEVSRTDGLLFELAGWDRPNRATPSARWHLSLSSPLRVNNRTSYSSPDAPVDRP